MSPVAVEQYNTSSALSESEALGVTSAVPPSAVQRFCGTLLQPFASGISRVRAIARAVEDDFEFRGVGLGIIKPHELPQDTFQVARSVAARCGRAAAQPVRRMVAKPCESQ